MTNRIVLRIALLSLALAAAAPAHAQLGGSHLLGDSGVGTATQPAPGVYAGLLYYRYSGDEIIRADGTPVVRDPSQSGNFSLHALAPVLVYVSPAKIFGANYGLMVVPGIANGSLEAPAFGVQQNLSTGPADLYVVPIMLGWHLPRADVTTGFGIYAPTGRYTAGADDNLGKNMWSYELSAGTTLFFDPNKQWSVSTSGYWETHSTKSGSGVKVGNRVLSSGVTVGDILTLEGGLGRAFLDGAANVGVAYYAQWKVTDDNFGASINLPDGSPLGKHRVYGLGPDVTLPIATKTHLIALVDIRYQWETGARVKTQGQTLTVTTTLPIPSVKIR